MQSGFNEAVAWWVATGINLKMLAEYEAQYGSIGNFWTRPKINGNRPLILSHVVPAFIFLGVAITMSLIVFVTELWFGRKEQQQGVGQRDKGRRTREAWVEGRRRGDVRGGREERGMVLRGLEEKIEVVSEGKGIEDKTEVMSDGGVIEDKTGVVSEGRGIEEKDVGGENEREVMENIGVEGIRKTDRGK